MRNNNKPSFRYFNSMIISEVSDLFTIESDSTTIMPVATAINKVDELLPLFTKNCSDYKQLKFLTVKLNGRHPYQCYMN